MIKFLFCVCLCFSYKVFLFFSFLREFFTILLVKYFFVKQKQSPECVLYKRRLKYLAKFIRKHLYWSPFFWWSCRVETYNFIKKRIGHRCFPVSFEKKKKSRKSSIADVWLDSKYIRTQSNIYDGAFSGKYLTVESC